MAYINGKKILQVVKTQFVPAVYQEKTISPANFQREVVADSGYAALSKVKINGILIDPHTEIESQTDTDIKYQKTVPAGALQYAGLNKVGGMSYKFNQVINKSRLNNTQTINGITFTNNNDGSITINGTATADVYFNVLNISQFTGLIVGHKYLLNGFNGTRVFQTISSVAGSIINEDSILTAVGTNTYLEIRISNGTTLNAKIVPMLTDLTDIYGAGNEPTSVAEFKERFNKDYYEYTENTLHHSLVTNIENKSFNIWNEEWESGVWSITVGQEATKGTNANYIRSKNYIDVLPNTDYYCKLKTNNDTIICLDENNIVLSIAYANSSGYKIITTPSNCVKLVFYSYGTTYNDDICINESDASVNGNYYPYKAPITMNIPAQVQLLNGYGMGVNSTVYNYIDFETKKFKANANQITLNGTEEWTYSRDLNDYACFSTIISGGVSSNPLDVISDKFITDSDWQEKEYIRLAGGTSISIIILKSKLSSVTNTDFREWLSNNNVIVVYGLATPVETDISEYIDQDTLDLGDYITFNNEYQQAVPSSITYLVEV